MSSRNPTLSPISNERDSQPHKLPSFAQAFPISSIDTTRDTSTSPFRSSLRSTHSDAGPSPHDAEQNGDARKRSREDQIQPPVVKDEMSEDELPNIPPSASTSNIPDPPKKKRRTTIGSASGVLSPPPIRHSPDMRPHNKHSLSGHSLHIQQQQQLAAQQKRLSPAVGSTSQYTLPSTESFTSRRTSLSARKAAPSALSLDPPSSSTSKSSIIGRHGGMDLQPSIQSAPPVPASRLRLYQMQASQPPPESTYAGTSGVSGAISVSSISRSRQSGIPGTGVMERDRDRGVRLSNPPKTAGLMGSSATPGGVVRTTVVPPTPSSAFHGQQHPQAHTSAHPPVPPTPSSLRHNLNQPKPSHPLAGPSQQQHTGAHQKAAFLAPFEALYDAVRFATAAAQSRGESTGGGATIRQVEDLFERKMRIYREENEMLRERVKVLEDLVRASQQQNGAGARKIWPPAVGNGSVENDKAVRETPSPAMSSTSLPPPPTRMNTSSSRLDPPPAASSSVKRPGGENEGERELTRRRSPLVRTELNGNEATEGETKQDEMELS